MLRDLIEKAGATDTEKLIATLQDFKFMSVAGPVVVRALDHQSTMGAWVGETAKVGKAGSMRHWQYEDGANYLFPEAEVKAARKH